MVKAELARRKRPGESPEPPGRCARWVGERAHLACRPLLQREHDVDHAHEEHEHHERADLQPSVRRARHLLRAVPCSRAWFSGPGRGTPERGDAPHLPHSRSGSAAVSPADQRPIIRQPMRHTTRTRQRRTRRERGDGGRKARGAAPGCGRGQRAKGATRARRAERLRGPIRDEAGRAPAARAHRWRISPAPAGRCSSRSCSWPVGVPGALLLPLLVLPPVPLLRLRQGLPSPACDQTRARAPNCRWEQRLAVGRRRRRLSRLCRTVHRLEDDRVEKTLVFCGEN